ncbi:putative outer membrane protein [Tenacibaculum sp. 190130A14a]|uniref:Long-chain fatty acid transport protein n=1 Tax=Tenacibaculum polynesiense TaxID=3137857 RepID=A0ABM9PDA1_9FLAO
MIKRILLGVFVFSSLTLLAQRNSASPYSFFGIGENFEAVTVEQASMGGIGVAMKDANYLNFINPAANADLRFATYAIGGSLTFINLKEGNESQSGNSTNLRYIALGFPVGKKAGFSVGLQPFSSVGYSLLNDSNPDDVTLFRGTGGTNKIYASFGMYVYEGLSLGVEAGFIFGNLENTILNQRTDVARGSKNSEELNIRGGQFKIGAQYKTEFKNKLQFHSGVAMTLESDLSGNGTDRLSSVTFNSSGAEIEKELHSETQIKGDITVPLKTVVGVGVGKLNKWYVGVNQQFQKALSTTNSLLTDGTSFRYDDSMKFSLGGYYIPKINSISSYWDRITYRAGFRYENAGLLVNSGNANNFTEIKDFGINVGLGLPLPGQLSNLNVGFEYGQRGTTNENLIQENYFNVRLSLSLNSTNWFKKRQID